MPAQQEHKTDRTGVYYIMGKAPGGGEERIYYIRFKVHGRLVTEKAGRAGQGMTPAKAARLRAAKIEGKALTNKAAREAEHTRKRKEADKPTLTTLWNRYTASRSLKGLAQDRSRFEKYVEPSLGSKTPNEITPMDVDRIRLTAMKGKSPQHIKLTLALLRRIVRFGVSMNLCSPLGFALKLPSVDNETTEDLTQAQLINLMKALDADHDTQTANLMRLALFTGMRRGELFRLTWADCDFERGFISIRHPKGGKSQTVPMNDAARAVLESHPQTGSDFVFPGRGGGQMTDAKRGLARIKRAAGLPDDFRPLHGLRHVYASMLASSGQVDLYTLQKLLTHKSPQMTQRYAHLRDASLRSASNLAGELVQAAQKQSEQTEPHENLREEINHG